MADSARYGNAPLDARRLLAARATTVDPVTCGYADGDAKRPRTANAGFNCRVDVGHGLWGFCPTSVLYARDCGFAAACIDRGSCSRGCGNMEDTSLATFICTGDSPFCSTVLLDSGPDQTYSYIACAAKPVTATLLAAPTENTSSVPTPRPSSGSSDASSATSTPAPASRPADGTQPSSSPSPTTVNMPATAASNPTGAIVGGVVGGIAFVCLTVLIVVLVVRRGRGRGREHSKESWTTAAADGYGPENHGPGELPGTVLEHHAGKSHPYAAATPLPASAAEAELGAFHGYHPPAELYGSPR